MYAARNSATNPTPIPKYSTNGGKPCRYSMWTPCATARSLTGRSAHRRAGPPAMPGPRERPAYNRRPMDSARFQAVVDWIGQNPLAAGLVIFLIAFGDALVIVGVAVPAVPLLFAVGTVVGLGHVEGWYALLCASLGAFVGD